MAMIENDEWVENREIYAVATGLTKDVAAVTVALPLNGAVSQT